MDFGGFATTPILNPAQYNQPDVQEELSLSEQAAGKTHISLLQECCTRRQTTPGYEIQACEGQVHEPTFMFQCTVLHMTERGQGKSKKVAKHLAAKRILERIVASGEHQEWGIPGKDQTEAHNFLNMMMPELNQCVPAADTTAPTESTPEANASKAATSDNPVGRLNERCVKRKWPPPEFDVEDEQGAAHEKRFVVVCRVCNYEEKGEGRNKRAAKRLAAEKMLQTINQLPDQDKYDVDDEALMQDAGNAYPKELEEELAHASKQQTDGGAAEKVATWAAEPPGERVSLRRLHGMDLEEMKHDAECKKLLTNICHEEPELIGVEPFYKNLKRRGKDGQFQSLVQLSMTPVAVCCGSGSSNEEAECDAAYNALQYLKMITKNEE